jgi:aspartyl-tRNA synthetase
MEAAGPLAKNIGPERTEAIRQQLGLAQGRRGLLPGRQAQAFEGVAGKARDVIGEELGLTDKDRFAFAWIVDFPMYEKDEETGKIDFAQPVLHAAGRDGGAGGRSAGGAGLPVRSGLQRL